MSTQRITALALGIALAATAPAAAQGTGHHHGHGEPSAARTDSARAARGDSIHASPKKKAAPGRGVKPAATADTSREHGHHGRTADAAPAKGVAEHAAAQPPVQDGSGHEMLMAPLGGGWSLMGMAQAFPISTLGEPFDSESPLRDEEIYLTQPAVMLNLESPGSRLVLRTTLNFEAETQPDGEYTFGGWGEGYLDKRHPHTFLHEAMLSLNVWGDSGSGFSLSAGKGFAPYGTDDPMSRPAVKYPTNHHLSQILERWTLNAVFLHRSGLSVEAGLFGGGEPTSPSDLENYRSFGDSWSARVAQRFGEGAGPFAPWELSGSYARVEEAHHGNKDATNLWNAALRHEQRYGFGTAYVLLEASRSEPEGEEQGYYALLAEAQIGLGRAARHRPYWRVEYATRPEYEREGEAGTDRFFRYDHGAHSEGSSRWLINTVGYGYQATSLPLSLRPFVELQHSRVWGERGDIRPEALFGTDQLWSVSTGFRVFVGGGPMRMGSYGVLDPMSASMRGSGQGHAHH